MLFLVRNGAAWRPRIQAGADPPNAGPVPPIRTRRDQQPIHRPVMIWAQRQPVVRLVVAADAERNDVGGINQRKLLAEFHTDAARRAAAIVDLPDRVADGAIAPRRLLVQGCRSVRFRFTMVCFLGWKDVVGARRSRFIATKRRHIITD